MKQAIRDFVEEEFDSAFEAVAALTIIVLLVVGVMAFLTLLWWPLPFVIAAVLGMVSATVWWAMKDETDS